IRLGECRGDSRECARPETCAAELGRDRQPKKAGFPEGINSLRREPTFLIVLPGGRGQDTICYLFCFRKRCLMIHGTPVLHGVAGRRRKVTLQSDSRFKRSDTKVFYIRRGSIPLALLNFTDSL